MKNLHKWFSLDDNDHISIDFALSENKDKDGNPLGVFQIYHKDQEEMIGNIYINEKQISDFINDLKSVQRRMWLVDKEDVK